jgi:hypothetical protein
MSMSVNVYRRALCAGALCIAACAAVLPLSAGGAEANIEGTWRIAAPQEAFKPVSGEIPFTAQGRKRYLENKRQQAKHNYDVYDIATARCASPGLPRLMLTPDRFRIWQRSGYMVFEFEWNRLFRQIDMGLSLPRIRITEDDAAVGRAVPPSMGRWEADTLLVTTEGFGLNTLVDNLVPHGYGLKLTERLHITDADTLEDRITIEDPEYFTRPWETVVTYKRQPDAAFAEDVCLDRLWSGQPTLSRK